MIVLHQSSGVHRRLLTTGRACDARGNHEHHRLFEIIRSSRSMRRLKRVPNELIRKILEAGVCAPSGGNMQRWHFLVIRDAAIKETVGPTTSGHGTEQVAPRYRAGEPAPGMSRGRFPRLLDATEYPAAHIHEAPVWIVPCLEGYHAYPHVRLVHLPSSAEHAAGGACARSGRDSDYASFTVREGAEAALDLPPGFHSYALLPIGYPVGRSGQSAVSLSPMWFTKIGGAHVIGIKNASLRLNAAALGLWRATKLSIRALF
jgi:nitroreductase